MTLDFTEDGTVVGLTNGELELSELGEATTVRYSHILPKNVLKRVAFRLLRSIVGDKGRVADWCRSWVCVWQVSLASDKNTVLFESSSRRECIEWEHRNFTEVKQ